MSLCDRVFVCDLLMCVCTYVCICMCVSVFLCSFMCICAFLCSFMCMCSFLCSVMCIRAFLCMTDAHIVNMIHVPTHTRTHKHVHPRSKRVRASTRAGGRAGVSKAGRHTQGMSHGRHTLEYFTHLHRLAGGAAVPSSLRLCTPAGPLARPLLPREGWASEAGGSAKRIYERGG